MGLQVWKQLANPHRLIQIDSKRRGITRSYDGISASSIWVLSQIAMALIFGRAWILGCAIMVSLNWQPLPGWYPLQILVFFLVLMLGYQIIHAPLAYYGGFFAPSLWPLDHVSEKLVARPVQRLGARPRAGNCVVELVYAAVGDTTAHMVARGLRWHPALLYAW